MEATKNKSTVCSNCGGQIDVNTLEEYVECPFCGTKYAVSDLLNESDAVRIEKIKTNAQQKIEQEKLKHEAEQSKNQAEQEEVAKFKKGKFSKIILVLFALDVIFFFTMSGFLGKALLFIQGVLLIASWLMGSKIIKESKKGLHNILAIIAFVLIVPILSLDEGISTKKYEKIVWNDIAMHDVLPEPKSDKGDIFTNSEESLSIYIGKSSREDYSKYVEDCKAKGFTEEAKRDTNTYDAFNADGYKLSLYYSEYSKEYNISLDAPMEMKENAWVSTPLSKLVPEPSSKIGKVDSNSEKSFTYYVGNTSKDDFSSYSNSVLNAGFSNDYQSGDTSFSGKNADGYEVNVDYEGHNVMKISITAPDKSTETTSEATTSAETTPTETAPEATTPTETTPEATTPAETTTPSNNNSSSSTSNNGGIRQDFKKAMDSYEAYIDEYIEFMEKYKANSTDLSLIGQYATVMKKYAEQVDAFEKWESEDLNTAEMSYYIEVQTRVSKKLLEVQ